MEPKVTIISATEMDATDAAALLIFTKHTRLKMSPDGLAGIKRRCKEDPEWMLAELEYMARTIRSSWEFLDLIFMVENVGRACAQQITRTRQASYAMQSQRVTDMSDVTFHIPESVDRPALYQSVLDAALEGYRELINDGISKEDARGVLPINAHCNLVAKYNLRTLADLVPARTSYRAQGEYNEVARQMREALVELWPWAELFLTPRNQLANSILDELIEAVNLGLSPHDLKILASKAKDAINGGDK